MQRVAAAMGAVVVLGACTGAVTETPPEGSAGISVVTSFYPIEEAASRVGGDEVDVVNLVPPGAEPHDVEVTSDELDAIIDADVVFYLGGGFQPAVASAAARTDGTAVDLLAGMDLLEAADHEGDHELEADPHVWLDPGRMIAIVERVRTALTEVAPEHADAFAERADAHVAELADLEDAYATGLADCRTRTLVVAHAAFGYLADRFDLEQHAIAGISPAADPDPARMAELTDLVTDEGVTTIFTETLVAPDVAETLAREAGVETAVLNPIEGLTRDELEAGADYLSVMGDNLATLRDGLGCT